MALSVIEGWYECCTGDVAAALQVYCCALSTSRYY